MEWKENVTCAEIKCTYLITFQDIRFFLVTLSDDDDDCGGGHYNYHHHNREGLCGNF